MSRLLNGPLCAPLLLLALGFGTRFLFIWHPSEVVFDEVHFGKFVSGYFTGDYFFDIHPPLGKLLIAAAAYIVGFRPGLNFDAIGEDYSGYSFVALRFLPNLFGAMIPLCVYFLVRSLRGSRAASLFAGLAVVFENAVLVQSHYILMDSMLLAFGFGGIALFFHYRNFSRKPAHLLLAGVLLALAPSVKWTGMSFLGIAGAVSLWDVYRSFASSSDFSFGEIARRALALAAAPFVVYFIIFVLHFTLLDRSGQGDAFMSQGFLKTLENTEASRNPKVKPIGLWEKFTELNRTMYGANAGLTAAHPYSSNFYSWPIMARPIYYWIKSEPPDRASRIYLLGNPFVWWGTMTVFILGVFLWKPKLPETKWILYGAWAFNFLPFMNIKRVMFLYHYFPALIFSVAAMSLFLFGGRGDDDSLSRRALAVFWGLIVLFIAGFIFFMPLTYGIPLTEAQFNLRLWFDKWL
ncbi:MAG: phospholipid carrier-dependent glycosyltransferase [Deltaproteobacteria bacterium]